MKGVDNIFEYPILFAFIIISIFLVIGKWVRLKVTLLQNFFIPTSLIAGFLLFATYNLTSKYNFFPNEVTNVWSHIPEIFITIIFASLFLGKDIPNIRKVWNIAKPQIALGQTIAWGQYVLGFIVTLLILVPLFDANILSGALIEMSFQGGPGVPSGLSDTFNKLGFQDGPALGLGLATFGVISGIVSGIIIVNWAVRKNKTAMSISPSNLSKNEKKGIYSKDNRQTLRLTTRSHSIDSLTIHVAVILSSIGLGYLLLRVLLLLENRIWDNSFEIFKYVPLFPLAMIGGVVIQVILSRSGYNYIINRKVIQHIQNLALDFLIVAAIANLSLKVISENTGIFITLALTGFLWNLFSLLVIAPRMIKSFWFERGIVDYGQSMGMTTTGLLLLQIVDPDKETPTFESFGYKQLFFEPFVGGGIFTALALPLTAQIGAYNMLIITSILFIFWLLFGLFSK